MKSNPKSQSGKKSHIKNRRSFKRQSAGVLARALTDKAMRQKGFMKAEIVSKWPQIVGPDFAETVMPLTLKFPAGKRVGATLEVRTHSAFAPLLQQSGQQILNKINIYFGYGAVEKMIIKQGPMPQKRVRPVRAVKPLDARETHLIEQITDGHKESDLGKAIQSMLTTVLTTK